MFRRSASLHSDTARGFSYSLPPLGLAELERLLASGGSRTTAETGSGASTIVFSRQSERHTVFAFNEFDSFLRILQSPLRGAAELVFVEGPTQRTLPHHCFETPLDAVLLDGPHAYPFPELEYFFFYPHLRPGALLVVDDIQIPTVHHLFQFLRRDAMFQLKTVIHRTAFFRRTDAATHPPDEDGWERQGFNARELLRYTWRHHLRRLVKR